MWLTLAQNANGSLIDHTIIEYAVYAFVGLFILVKSFSQISSVFGNGRAKVNGKDLSAVSFALDTLSAELSSIKRDLAVVRAENHDLHVWHDIDHPSHPGQKVWYANHGEADAMLVELRRLASLMDRWLAQGCPNDSISREALTQISRKIERLRD